MGGGPAFDPAWGLATLRGLLARPLASYYLLLSSSGLLLVIGLTMVFSATSVRSYADDGNAFALIAKQATYAVFGLLAFWACQRLPARTYRTLGTPLLVASFLLLAVLDALTLLKAASMTKEARLGPVVADNLWLHLGPLQVQPSELAKFALVLWGADVLVRKGAAIGWWRELASPLFVVVALLFVMVGYTDLGTMLCLITLFLGLLWAAGVQLRVFSGLVVAALVGVALLVQAPGKDSYRMGRLDAFVNPASDSCQQMYCYQAMQGRYAIAEGGWFGVGLGKGSLKWGWLPNGHNDFIFALVGEELGVVGCLVVLALFGVLTYTGLRIARRVADPYRRLAAAAVTAWLVGQATINIGGVVGLLPITGLPLPFISDGGSALVVTFAAVGMLASFARAEPDAARALHARPPAHWVRLLWAPLPPLPAAARASEGSRPVARARPGGTGGQG
ncbi:MAG TPA: putative peptidoglycan glycosyltransferase FtsW [Micromonosporaceae bacterium]|nr:putative peptidoglycan glycosyltransferase FtsW [Micromonosporaceae bacterium]